MLQEIRGDARIKNLLVMNADSFGRPRRRIGFAVHMGCCRKIFLHKVLTADKLFDVLEKINSPLVALCKKFDLSIVAFKKNCQLRNHNNRLRIRRSCLGQVSQ